MRIGGIFRRTAVANHHQLSVSLMVPLLFFFFSCSSENGVDECTPGDSRPCTCPGDSTGTQECAADGSKWLDCACDGCPDDPEKTEPGVCGCGIEDADSDGDGTMDCIDDCPSDPYKTRPGICGCGIQDTDTDGDGFLDCSDLCPNDPDKTEPGACGCGVDVCFEEYKSVSAGRQHTCGIHLDGTMWCWGRNRLGQLGDGTGEDRRFPIQVGSESDWVSVTVGGHHNQGGHTCGIRNDGVERTLWCWGSNHYGQLGDGGLGDQFHRYTPTRIGPATDWVAVVAGDQHTCGIRNDGTRKSLWCWGWNYYGQLGREYCSPLPIPTHVETGDDWVDVAAGWSHTCGIMSDGTLWCWGHNYFGQLGDGTTDERDHPVQVGTDNDWVAVDGGEYHTCGVRDDRTSQTLWCWGRGYNGELGNGTIENKNVPTQVGTDTDWLSVSVGEFHTCGTRGNDTDRSLWCWGLNNSGQLGNGTYGDEANSSAPSKVGDENDWIYIAGGDDHTCGIRDNGVEKSIYCWGNNQKGQLGVGDESIRSTPSQTGEFGDWFSVTAVTTGRTCGLNGDELERSLYCWGTNGGVLGDGTRLNRKRPVRIGMDNDWVALATGASHICGVREGIDGRTLWCWGGNEKGQLGVGSSTEMLVPTQVGSEVDWIAIAAGSSHTCGIRDDGLSRTLWCWGSNRNGRLGDGSMIDMDVPTQVGTHIDWVEITAGDQHTCGIRDDGVARALWCWGNNYTGQLGNGDYGELADRIIPAQVVKGLDWNHVEGGGNHTCGIRGDGDKGTLWCWGFNEYGQLGNGINGRLEGEARPTQVGADADWVTVSSGSSYTCGIRDNGSRRSLWCWGVNNCSQLGDGNKEDRNVLTSVRLPEDWTAVSSGAGHTCGIRDDGSSKTLWCWGMNGNGQVGQGYPWSEYPVQVIR